MGHLFAKSTNWEKILLVVSVRQYMNMSLKIEERDVHCPLFFTIIPFVQV